MNDAAQAITGMIGMWMLLQLAVLLAMLLGGLYALYCLSRAASGLDRLAGAVEEWVERQAAQNTPPLPGVPGASGTRPAPLPPVPPVPMATVPPTTTPLRPMEVPIAAPPPPPPAASPLTSPLTTTTPFTEETLGEMRGDAREEKREI